MPPIPWPAKAASPCIDAPGSMLLHARLSPARTCLARTYAFHDDRIDRFQMRWDSKVSVRCTSSSTCNP